MTDRPPSGSHTEPDNPEQQKLLRKQGTALPEAMTAHPQPSEPGDRPSDATRPETRN